MIDSPEGGKSKDTSLFGVPSLNCLASLPKEKLKEPSKIQAFSCICVEAFFEGVLKLY